jgi:hypothetical protein
MTPKEFVEKFINPNGRYNAKTTMLPRPSTKKQAKVAGSLTVNS